jgi:hypothetical protein
MDSYLGQEFAGPRRPAQKPFDTTLGTCGTGSPRLDIPALSPCDPARRLPCGRLGAVARLRLMGVDHLETPP